jgi:hypothetical protein
MKTYDQRWYELHADLKVRSLFEKQFYFKGMDDVYKIVYHSKQLFQSNSPMYLAGKQLSIHPLKPLALSEDMSECLRARMERWKRHHKELKRIKDEAVKQERVLEHTLSVQYNNENHKLP